MEKVYKTMRATGVGNLVIGILVIVLGILSGVYMIVNGVVLLKRKSDLLF